MFVFYFNFKSIIYSIDYQLHLHKPENTEGDGDYGDHIEVPRDTSVHLDL